MNEIKIHVLSRRATAIAAGLTLSVFFGLCAILSAFEIGAPLQQLFATLFVGFAPTPAGFFVSLVWGFLTGGMFGAFFAWIYNLIVT